MRADQASTSDTGGNLLRGALTGVVILVLLTSVVPLVPAQGSGKCDPKPDRAEGCYKTIQTAVDAANDTWDVVVVPASHNAGNPTPYPENVAVDQPDLTVCSATADADGDARVEPGWVFLAQDTTACTPKPGSTIVDGSGRSPTVVDVQARNVTLWGLTVRWTGDPTEPVTGVAVDGPEATLRDVTVELPGAWCNARDDGVCSGAKVTGVYARASTVVEDARIRTTGTNGADPTDFAGTWGVNANSDARVVVDNVTFRGWAIGSVNWAPNLVIRDATFEGNFRGVQTAAGHIRVASSTFRANDAAVYVAGQSRPENITLRGNHLGLSNRRALLFEAERSDTVVDARANHWGVVGRHAVPQRFGNAGDNTVLYMPYRDAAGDLHPPAPQVFCDTGGSLERVDDEIDAEILTLQQAENAPLPDVCDTQHRTIALTEDAETYDGATVDTPVTVTSGAPFAARRQAEADGGARIRALVDEPALRFVDGSQGSAVKQVTVEGRAVGATGIAVDDVPGANVRVQDVEVLSREAGISTGLHVSESSGVTVVSSTFGSGIPVVELDQAADVTVKDTTIHLAPASVADGRTVAGVDAASSDHVRVENVAIRGQGDSGTVGVRVAGGRDVAVVDSTVAAVESGVAAQGVQSLTVEGNEIVGSGLGRNPADHSAWGVRIGDGTSDWTVRDNRIADFGFAGVGVHARAASGGTIRANRIEGSGLFGVYVGQDLAVDVVGNAIDISGVNGINLESTSDTRVVNNTVSVTLLPGVAEPVDAPGAGLWVQGGEGTQVLGNTFTGTVPDSVLLSAFGAEDGTPDTVDQPQLEPMRFNEFVLLDALEDPSVSVPSVRALRLGDHVEDVTVDARLNDWGVYEYQLVRQRAVEGATSNEVLQIPYLMPNGPHGLPVPG